MSEGIVPFGIFLGCLGKYKSLLFTSSIFVSSSGNNSNFIFVVLFLILTKLPPLAIHSSLSSLPVILSPTQTVSNTSIGAPLGISSTLIYPLYFFGLFLITLLNKIVCISKSSLCSVVYSDISLSLFCAPLVDFVVVGICDVVEGVLLFIVLLFIVLLFIIFTLFVVEFVNDSLTGLLFCFILKKYSLISLLSFTISSAHSLLNSLFISFCVSSNGVIPAIFTCSVLIPLSIKNLIISLLSFLSTPLPSSVSLNEGQYLIQ